MKIETQISASQYLRLMMEIFLKKPIFIFFEFIGLSLLCCYFFNWNIEGTAITPMYYLGFAIFFIFINPLLFYLSSKKQISKMPELTEKIIYTFSNDTIILSVKDANTEILWEDVKKIKENPNWFFFIQKNKVVNFIPKSALGDNYEKFKTLLKQKGFLL